ncbi:hypothetical protein LZ198_19970 [Myxococcus sp. K15C18031901]|uniref:hypothetical protein n=1 Tax=Myxococcus dinghuensis TaxID=2906761 RepID=UPI0020A7FDCA|nr:hypothetical protein [Myxococcus dinghuensis]MCP3101157.1 hypothetical protein [Myxococcus dinghuensis]
MRAFVLALVLAASAPTPAQKAKELSSKKAWDELYLAFSSGDANTVPKEQRAAVSGALATGCEALLAEDMVMASALGERAVVFEETAPALHCVATAARRTDQRAAAEAALRKGLQRFPKDGSFPLELGKLLLEEQDSVGAVAALEQVPPRSKEGAEAKKLLQQARQSKQQESDARSEAARIERQLGGATRLPTEAPPPVPLSGSTPRYEQEPVTELTVGNRNAGGKMVKAPTVGFESSVDSAGKRVRANRRFVIKYNNNSRDFRQRANYEGRVVEVLEEAYYFARDTLGQARENPVEVVLYSADEFRDELGAGAAAMAAGLYSANAIRINNAVELTKEAKATLVHEYIHAVVDDFCGGGNRDNDTIPLWLNEGLAEYLEWKYLKQEGPTRNLWAHMRQAQVEQDVPSLHFLVNNAPITSSNPMVGYGVSALAVRELVRREGYRRILRLIEDLCENRGTGMNRGKYFEKALRTHYGLTMDELDKELAKQIGEPG